MTDVHNIETRSYNMSQIKGKDTKPEILVRKFLHVHGFRYSLHDKKLPGKPDIVLKKYNTIIDVRGCFWHMHSGCKYGDKITTPSVKITGHRKTAVERDKIKLDKWKEMGWNVIVIWADCELEPRRKKSVIREKTLNNLLNKLKRGNTNN
jgi:DNA mismatch endonuclease (patch repair protein)